MSSKAVSVKHVLCLAPHILQRRSLHHTHDLASENAVTLQSSIKQL